MNPATRLHRIEFAAFVLAKASCQTNQQLDANEALDSRAQDAGIALRPGVSKLVQGDELLALARETIPQHPPLVDTLRSVVDDTRALEAERDAYVDTLKNTHQLALTCIQDQSDSRQELDNVRGELIGVLLDGR